MGGTMSGDNSGNTTFQPQVPRHNAYEMMQGVYADGNFKRTEAPRTTNYARYGYPYGQYGYGYYGGYYPGWGLTGSFPTYSQGAQAGYAALPRLPYATVGLDVDGDGKADYLVRGVDRDMDGIPDALEAPSFLRSPYYDYGFGPYGYGGFGWGGYGGWGDYGYGNPYYRGRYGRYGHFGRKPYQQAEAAPQASVYVDVDGDGAADYLVTGADRDRDGIPDALQGNGSFPTWQ